MPKMWKKPLRSRTLCSSSDVLVKMLFSGSVRKNSCVSSYIDTKRKLWYSYCSYESERMKGLHVRAVFTSHFLLKFGLASSCYCMLRTRQSCVLWFKQENSPAEIWAVFNMSIVHILSADVRMWRMQSDTGGHVQIEGQWTMTCWKIKAHISAELKEDMEKNRNEDIYN